MQNLDVFVQIVEISEGLVAMGALVALDFLVDEGDVQL